MTSHEKLMRKFALSEPDAVFTTHELAAALGRDTPAGRRAVTALMKVPEFRSAGRQATGTRGAPRSVYGLADTRRALVLRYLYRVGYATAAEVAEDIGTSKQRAKAALAELCAEGLVVGRARVAEMGTLYAVQLFADELADYDAPMTEEWDE